LFTLAALIILVNRDERELRHTEALLSDAGYLVAASASYEDAQQLMDSVAPNLLIATFATDDDQGRDFAVWNRLRHPQVPVIVTHPAESREAGADMAFVGAAFTGAPLENPQFLPQVQAAVVEGQRAQAAIRCWPRATVTGLVQVHVANAVARVVDLSYAGVRLMFDDRVAIPTSFEMALPTMAMPVQAERVWTVLDTDKRVCCGATVVEAARETWRQFVDSVRLSDSPVN
jgi:hypothetical protein